MVYFPSIDRNWDLIAHRSVISIDGTSHEATSLKGRGICLIHALATPLKALSGVGMLAFFITETAVRVLGVLTLNSHPKELIQAVVSLVDIPLGALLLPIALLANVIRGVAGTIFHPGAMIVDRSAYRSYSDFNHFAANHNILFGTLINYFPLPDQKD
jgi:hypothetical protein